MHCPAKLTPAKEGGYIVTFRDIPEVIMQGDDITEATEMAGNVLQSAMGFHSEDQYPVPPSSASEEDKCLVAPLLSVYSKVSPLNGMLAQDVNKSELVRHLETMPQEVQRITGLHHVTRIDAVIRALAQLGKQLEIRLA